MLAKLAALGINTNSLIRHATLAGARRDQMARTGLIFMVVQGCDGRFWVVSARDAGKLRKAGYETI